MYRNAVSGEDPNNDKFSPCSKERILPKVAPLRVIQIKKHDIMIQLLSCASTNFNQTKNATCSNFRVEEGEECDPGSFKENKCCTSSCTFNSKSTTFLFICLLVCLAQINATCDESNPKQRLCCQNCHFRNEETVCHEASACKESSHCSGVDAVCPEQNNKIDGTECTDSDGVDSTCKNGMCQNACERLTEQLKESNAYALHSCYCMSETDFMCSRCCQKGENQTSYVV